MDKKEFDLLYNEALKGYKLAYAPYSKFKVGASCLLKNGKVFHGCNIENSSYGLSNCAERTCLFNVYSNGYHKDDIVAFMILGQTKDPISPCGACRQVMCELLNGDVTVYLTNLNKDFKEYKVSDLLPYSFSGDNLDE